MKYSGLSWIYYVLMFFVVHTKFPPTEADAQYVKYPLLQVQAEKLLEPNWICILLYL